MARFRWEFIGARVLVKKKKNSLKSSEWTLPSKTSPKCMGRSLWSRHSAKYSTWINSLNSLSLLTMTLSTVNITISKMRKLKHSVTARKSSPSPARIINLGDVFGSPFHWTGLPYLAGFWKGRNKTVIIWFNSTKGLPPHSSRTNVPSISFLPCPQTIQTFGDDFLFLDSSLVSLKLKI